MDFCFRFFIILADFRGARLLLMSKSSSSRFFALDGQIFRPVRRLGLIFRFFTVRTWGKARVTEIPEGGSAPPDPLTTTFQKICPLDKFFEMILKKKTSASTVVDATFGRKIERIEKTECIEPKFYRSYRSKAALLTNACFP